MSPKQRAEKRTAQQLKLSRFADEWLKNGGNASKASRALWPHLSPQRHRVNGSKMLKLARDGGLLSAMVNVASRAMGIPELIARESEVARADIGDFVTVDPKTGAFTFDLSKAKGKTHLIKTLRHDAETGAPVVELYSAAEARKTLGKWSGLTAEKPAPPPQVDVTFVLGALPAEARRAFFRAMIAGGSIEPAHNDDGKADVIEAELVATPTDDDHT